MEFEFDKEMESLLRQMAKGENVSALDGGHIDADEISMFAENVLPNAARPRVMNHLADCVKCRTNLSNVIVLNSEAEAAMSASATFENNEAVAVATTQEIPWYQKLFATKNLAYGMGALALIFAVGIGFIVFQNASNLEGENLAKADANANVAMAEPQSAEVPNESNETANANTNTDSLSEGGSNIADTNASANSSSDASTSTDAKVSTQAQSSPNVIGQNRAEGVVAPPPPPATENSALKRETSKDKNLSDDEASSTADVTVEEERDETKLAEKSRVRTDGVDKNEDQPSANKPSPVTTRSSGTTIPKSPAKKDKSDNADDRKKSKESNPTRQVGNKTFTRKNGIWYDSAYKKQSTTTVKRGSSKYKKLDTSLQSIGNQLDGTVIVIWNSKAYKIQ